MLKRRNACIALFAALLIVLGSAAELMAQAAAAKADATGTWKWTQLGRGGGRGPGGGGGGGGRGPGGPGAPGGGPATQPGGGAGAAPGGGGGGGGRGGAPIEITAALKQEGEKLTGNVMGVNFQDPAAKVDIKEGSVKSDGALTFKVTTTGGRGEITRIYKGKLEGDKITGTSEFDFGAGPGAPPGGAAPPPGGAPGGGAGRGFGGPQEWVATRQK